MKIVHLMLANYYIDNFSYQENMLPKYHKKQGYDVEIITYLFTFDETGQGVYLTEPQSYINEYGIPVTRLAFKEKKFSRRFRVYDGLYNCLEKSCPDILFIHGLQFVDIREVVRYLRRHRGVVTYVDNHADFNNSAQNLISKYFLNGVIWNHCAHIIEPYTKRFYGVTPARVEFLRKAYNLPKDKIELLPLGADDDQVKANIAQNVRTERRKELSLTDKDILIVTGGKIDCNKPETIILMEVVNKLNIDNVKLIVFGSVTEQLQERFKNAISDKVIFVGWRKPEEIYREFAAADIVMFPGLHSVLWEQAVAMGKPCVFRKIEGFNHIDLGGNCLFFKEIDENGIKKTVLEAINYKSELEKVAKKKGIKYFSYAEIAKRSIKA